MSPRVAVHHHPCQSCQVKLECGGTWTENYDGFPDVICPEFHRPGGTINQDFLCEECQLKAEASAPAQEDHA